jgi:hypothetical protein
MLRHAQSVSEIALRKFAIPAQLGKHALNLLCQLIQDR